MRHFLFYAQVYFIPPELNELVILDGVVSRVDVPEPPTIVLFLIGALIAIRLKAFKLSPHLQT